MAGGLDLSGIWYPSSEIREDMLDNHYQVEVEHGGKILRIHAFRTGYVQVKESHLQLRWPAAMRFPRILADRKWAPPIPVWCWLIEHPEGMILIDTGESSRATEPDFFACDPQVGRVYRYILRPQVQLEEEIGALLRQQGKDPTDIRWVVLTHLHSDHIDGVLHFPKSEFILSKTEHQNPYGAVTCVLPNWFKPRLITYQDSFSEAFPAAYALTQAQDVWVLPTPGHSHGHQSVVLRLADRDIFFAGDTTFSQQQLLSSKIGGINTDVIRSRETLARIHEHAQSRSTCYLPSHDAEAGRRLLSMESLGIVALTLSYHFTVLCKKLQ